MPVRLRPRAQIAASAIPPPTGMRITLLCERGMCHAFEKDRVGEHQRNAFLRISPHIHVFLTDNITKNVLVFARITRHRTRREHA